MQGRQLYRNRSPHFASSNPAVRAAQLILLLGLSLMLGCQPSAHQLGLARLAELQVQVEVRTSRIGPDTYAVDIRSDEELDEVFSLILEHCRPMRRLSARGRDLSPFHLHQISQLEELKWLDLYGVSLDESADALADLPSLKSLNIAGADAGDEHLRELAPALEPLETLAVGPQTTDDGLHALATATKLRTLFLGDSQVTGAGLAHLPQDSLRALWLDRSKFHDGEAAQLKRFSKLERLGLSELPITDDAVLVVAQLNELDYLSLENTNVTDASIEPLAKLPKLYVLDTPGSKITAGGVKRLKELRPEILVGE